MPIDKQYHFLAGFCIYLIAALFMPAIQAMIPVIVIATGKEVWDYVNMEGTPDINDLLYTIYGAMPVLILKLLLT
jgi:hypothetical protein